MSDRPDIDELAKKMQDGGWKITGGKYAPKSHPKDNATCKTCGGVVPNHLPTFLDRDGIGAKGHKINANTKDNRLRDILEHIYVTATQDERGVANNRKGYRMRYEEVPAVAEQQIIELMLEIVGEDKPRPYRQSSEYGDAQNDLRNELRRKILALGEKK